MLLVIPGLIDTTNAAMPACRKYQRTLVWAFGGRQTSLQQTGEPSDVASPVLRCQGRAMRTLRLSTVGAVCALGTVICFVLGGVAMGSSGVGVLIPEAGPPGRELIASVAGAGWLFFAGAWLIILMGYLGIVALVGFYDTLRSAGPVMILAPILGAVGLTLVTVSHLIPIGWAMNSYPPTSTPTRQARQRWRPLPTPSQPPPL